MYIFFFIALITIVSSIVIHFSFAYYFGGLQYFKKERLLANTLGVGLIFTIITETASVGVEYVATGNLYGAIISRGISFLCSLSLAGFLVCYLEWFYVLERQVWDKISHPLFHKYVESTVCSLIVWGCMSTIKLIVMRCFLLITTQQALIMFCTSMGVIILGVGNLLMQLIILYNKKRKEKKRQPAAPIEWVNLNRMRLLNEVPR